MNKFILQKLFDLNLFIKILLKALYINIQYLKLANI